MDWKKLLGSITESVDEELRLRNAYLGAENRILRQQISGRIQLSDSDRRVLAEIGKKLGVRSKYSCSCAGVVTLDAYVVPTHVILPIALKACR
jgi:hypothetical protein